MAAPLTSSPFVLLDDARATGAAPARLYEAPVEIIAAHEGSDIRPALDQIATAQRQGLHVAGFLSYEAGHVLEPRLDGLSGASTFPRLWFGLFEGYREIPADKVADLLPDPAGGWAGFPRPEVDQNGYAQLLGRVQSYIAAGDIYQANLTFQNRVSTAGHPLAIYAGLRSRARSGYGGVVWTGTDWLLSLSPELFFALHSGKVTTKPMKGTSTRGANAAEDQTAISELRSDPKQRAENLMIVDLLRNDLSRVAVPGSVAVPHLFTVETYPTVHTMTSTVTAQLTPGENAASVIAAIYPCGSITGAPKIRAMEIIAELETAPRGIYTGSIGRIDPSGDAAFNVAIRTLHLQDGSGEGRLGLGSGVVADSKMGEEWRECLAKGTFVGDRRSFDLIETMRFDPDEGIFLLERHLARLMASAAVFDFRFDRHAARNELQAATFRLTHARRIRLLLSRTGRMAVEIGALAPKPDEPVSVAVVPLPVDPADFRLRHKTTDRAFYEAARQQAGSYEVALIDPDGFVTEGSFTNIFVARGDTLVTPPLSRGLLPGVLREELIETGRTQEADLRAEDLLGGFFIGNASRGLIAAKLS